MTSVSSAADRLQGWLRHLYESSAPDAQQFRYGLVAFDVITILFIVATSFVPRHPAIETLDLIFGLLILADFSARLFISRQRLRDLMHPVTWADVAAVVSFLAPLIGEPAGFLRILRTLRLLRSYHLLARLRADFPYFREHEEVIIAATNFGVFLFVTTGFIYQTQHLTNPAIANYADALYFSVTALTTTGFGDITLPDTTGRLISVVIMLLGGYAILRSRSRGAAPREGALSMSEMRPVYA